MRDLEKAKGLLALGEYTCVLCKDEKTYTSRARGVKPLVAWREHGTDLSDLSAADKVVGKATAFLYLLHGVKALYAGVISYSALTLLEENGIYVEYGRLVPSIINRSGDGICPFEKATLEISDKNEAYEAILEKMKELNISI